MNKPKIVLLAGKGESTNIVYHRLLQHIAFAAVVIEEPVNKKNFKEKNKKIRYSKGHWPNDVSNTGC
ncbi:MAG: hypothetical protein IPP48_05590 [Chitinophagaceae bacterium]|nr:hypothetical protein [Chitinophagaceae bacterium]